jgi:flagellar hook-basal body complex protein FliE
MSIEAIAAVTAGISTPSFAAQTTALNASLAASGSAAGQLGGTSFDTVLTTLQNLSADIKTNAQSVEQLAAGESASLHRVLMDLEATKLKFDFALQVRNKILDSYQELMRMQI